MQQFQTFHGVTEKNQYVNISGIEPSIIYPAKITVKMLCTKCEGLGEEEKLARHYCFFNAKPFCTVKFDNKDSWFHHTLAVIMVRGILMNCNLLKELQTPNSGITTPQTVELQTPSSGVLQAMFDLLAFCVNPSKHKLPRALSVFLLPHDFYSKNPDMFSLFERQLRNPEFTSVFDLHSEGSEGRFFYMQFDCIHVTYPLCDVGAHYFQQHTHKDYPCGISDSDVQFPSSDVRKHLFPCALLSINLSRALNCAKYWIEQPCSDYFNCSLAFVKYHGQELRSNSIPKYTVPESLNHDDYVLDYDTEVRKQAKEKEGKHQVYMEACESEAKRWSILRRLSIFKNITPAEQEHFLTSFGRMQQLLSKGPPSMELVSKVRNVAETLGESLEGLKLQKAIADFEEKVERWEADMSHEKELLDKLIAKVENKPSTPVTSFDTSQLPISTEENTNPLTNSRTTMVLATGEVVAVLDQTPKQEHPMHETLNNVTHSHPDPDTQTEEYANPQVNSGTDNVASREPMLRATAEEVAQTPGQRHPVQEETVLA